VLERCLALPNASLHIVLDESVIRKKCLAAVARSNVIENTSQDVLRFNISRPVSVTRMSFLPPSARPGGRSSLN